MKKIIVIALAIVVAFAGAAFADANRTFVSLADVLDGLRGGAEQTAGNSYAMVVYVSGGNEALTSVALDAAGKPLLRGLALNVFAQRIGAGDQSIADFLDSIGGGGGGGSFFVGSSAGTYSEDAYPGTISVGPDGKVYVTECSGEVAWFNPDGSFGGYIDIDHGAFEAMNLKLSGDIIWGPDGKVYIISGKNGVFGDGVTCVSVIDPDAPGGWAIEHVFEQNILNGDLDARDQINGISCMTFSPDGDLIITYTTSNISTTRGLVYDSAKRILTIDPLTNEITSVVEIPPAESQWYLSAPLFLPDGDVLVSVGDHFYIFDPANPAPGAYTEKNISDFDWLGNGGDHDCQIWMTNGGFGNMCIGTDGRIYAQFSDDNVWDTGFQAGIAVFEIGPGNDLELVRVIGPEEMGLEVNDERYCYGMTFSPDNKLYFLAEEESLETGDWLSVLTVLDPTVLWD